MTIYTLSTCNTVSIERPIISRNIHHVYCYRQGLQWINNRGVDLMEKEDPVILIKKIKK